MPNYIEARMHTHLSKTMTQNDNDNDDNADNARHKTVPNVTMNLKTFS